MPERELLTGKDRLLGTPGEFSVRRCDGCGAGVTFPIVDEAELGAYYAGEYIATETWKPNKALALVSRTIHAWNKRLLLRSLPLSVLKQRSGNLLDVGCGRGELGAVLVERGWRVSGIEPSESGFTEATTNGMEVQRGTLATTRFDPESFDVVNFRHSLEHVVDPYADLETAVALLAPGGLLLIEVPHFNSWQRKLFGSKWFHLDLPRHRTHFTRDGIAALLQRRGLVALEIGTKTSSSGLAGSLQYKFFGRWIAEGALATRVAAGLFAILSPFAFLTDKIAGDGDFLFAVAEKPSSHEDR